MVNDGRVASDKRKAAMNRRTPKNTENIAADRQNC
jgi:hypothetical protein